MNQLQQGDVLIQEISEFPAGVQPKKVKMAVLAEGEVTGHAHRIHEGIRFFMDDGGSGTCYFEVDKTVSLNHEEHKTIEIPPGKYKSFIVQEFDHLEEATRRVAD